MLKVSNLNKTIDSIHIIKDINFSLHPGEVVAFLGENGAGKSTTVKILAGIKQKTSGEIIVKNLSIDAHENTIKKFIGYLPEHCYFYEYLTGNEYLDFIAGLYSLDKNTYKQTIFRYINFFDIDKWMNNLIINYPKGVIQKLSIIATLIHDPEIIILDEPTAGLDPKSTKLVKILLQKLKEEKKTILLVTHILEIAEALSDRIIVIHKGEIKAKGTINELRNKIDKKNSILEEIFLTLTGGIEYIKLVEYLKKVN